MFHIKHRWAIEDVHHFYVRYFKAGNRETVDEVPATDVIERCDVCAKRRSRRINSRGHFTAEQVYKWCL